MSTESKKSKLGRKTQIILVVLGLLAIVAICAVVVATYAKSIITEGTVDLSVPAASLTEIPASDTDKLTYLSSLVSKTRDSSKARVSMNNEIDIDSDSITIEGGTDGELGILKHIKGTVLDSVRKHYDSYNGSFGDNLEGCPDILLTPDDTTLISCERGITGEDGTVAEDGYYFFDITVPEMPYPLTSSDIATTFDVKQTQTVIEGLSNDTEGFVKIGSNSKLACKGFEITAKSNRLTDELSEICFSRSYHVTMELEFLGDFASLGNKTVSFDYKVKTVYRYVWAGASFTADKITLGVGEDEQAGINAIIADDAGSADYEISFESSDSSIATVDENGIVTGVKISDKPVIITMTFKYLGNTYTDTCEAYVLNAVEKILVSPSELTLKSGDISPALEYTIEPADATITDVLWFTEDESIAIVDKDGKITALRPGSTKIYAVTVDGSFRSSCTVTVTQ